MAGGLRDVRVLRRREDEEERLVRSSYANGGAAARGPRVKLVRVKLVESTCAPRAEYVARDDHICSWRSV